MRLGLVEMYVAQIDSSRSRLELALRFAERIDEPQVTALVAYQLARLQRLAFGDLDAASWYAQRAVEVADMANYHLVRVCGRCERGHIAIARGNSATPHLVSIDELAVGVAAAPWGELARRLDELRRTQESWSKPQSSAAGDKHRCDLYRGSCVRDIARPLARHLSLLDPEFPQTR